MGTQTDTPTTVTWNMSDKLSNITLSDNLWKVEAYIGYTDQTWTTAIIGIPTDTPYEKIEEAIEKEVLRLWSDNPDLHTEIAFTKLYNDYVEETEEDEDE